ncbi:hypothetical protein SLEP1_g12565 [Rubroshorea leprosula]|uniref:Uncharacterized protein n=1 Tax=Rubroshorea leprosula TaxID=152421 RepID=A0AAV5INK4_9ROSI|nr:hypothetical protein SLEP1_g12565 [Rubroshorea leprosula]
MLLADWGMFQVWEDWQLDQGLLDSQGSKLAAKRARY